MTNEEAIHFLEIIKSEITLNHYRRLALEKAIESIEKQIPKNPEDLQPVKNAAGYAFSKSGKCPCCGETVECYCNSWVCDFCGQAIDWGDEGC